MRRLLLPLIVAALAPVSCGSPPHVSADLVYRHSLDFPSPQRLRQGWTRVWVGRELERVDTLIHRVIVIPEFAGDLMIMPGRQRERMTAEIACPPLDHPVWEELTRGQDIEIDLETADRGRFTTVSCRGGLR
ncbi:MAG: hypothetical protein OYL92_07435 [Acidobacteriota bacterium]|nr:hypothetical protein [Acidobacteriota bacterium]MXX63412.1 hypothetical protein [Holophagales bacterium]MDE2923827.1 hypothetical protein [Acidobacteriota bacterium]MDE3264789.1 hypothetical protein [Acidobacteriota bacterium]MXZ38205.1 hypothetical protein [Holophagales bacterium]